MNVAIGIDPGCSGSLVALDQAGFIIDLCIMPTMKVGTKSRVNGAAVAGFLKSFNPLEAHVYLEQVGAMPGQGTASMFTFGHAAGLVEGVVTGMGFPITLVPPAQWKKYHGLINTEKDVARTRAIQLYPTRREFDAKGKGQALADATLLARFGLKL